MRAQPHKSYKKNVCHAGIPGKKNGIKLYTLNIYAHFSAHFSQQLLMAEI
jgi:hypothetical protein